MKCKYVLPTTLALSLNFMSCSSTSEESDIDRTTLAPLDLKVPCKDSSNREGRDILVPVDFNVFDFHRNSTSTSNRVNRTTQEAHSWKFDNYANNVRYKWSVVVGSSYTSADIIFSNWDFENAGDYLQFLSLETTFTRATGGPISKIDIPVSWYQEPTLQGEFQFIWNSDEALNNNVGWAIDEVKVTCKDVYLGSPEPKHKKIASQSSHDVILAGDGESIYFEYHPGEVSTSEYVFIDLETRTLPLDAVITASWESDGLGQYPGRDPHTYSTLNKSVGQNDTLLLNAAGRSNDVLWIGVHSRSGKGHARLRVSSPEAKKMYVEQMYHEEFAHRYAQRDRYTDYMESMFRNYSRHLFAATDGAILIDEWKLLPFDETCGDNRSNCVRVEEAEMISKDEDSICPVGAYACCTNRSDSKNPGKIVMRTRPFTNYIKEGVTFSHEWAHCYAKYGEEYQSDDTQVFYGWSACGHSIQGSLDTLGWNMNDFCVSRNHRKDPIRTTLRGVNGTFYGPGSSAISEPGSVWSFMSRWANVNYPQGIVQGFNPDPYEYYLPNIGLPAEFVARRLRDQIFNRDMIRVVSWNGE